MGAGDPLDPKSYVGRHVAIYDKRQFLRYEHHNCRCTTEDAMTKTKLGEKRWRPSIKDLREQLEKSSEENVNGE